MFWASSLGFHKKGFTLIEILVVTSIIIFLSAMILPGYRSGENQLALQRSANKLAQDIRRAQEMSMSAKEAGGGVPSGGYGVYFDTSNPDQYILFADSDGGHDYDVGEAVGNPIKFEKNVKINSLFPSSPLTITFTPPDPTVTFNNNPSLTSVTITIKNDGQLKTITANKTGLIYVE